MKHRYLEEAGWGSYAENNWKHNCPLWKRIRYYFQKRKTGVDPRSCYDLNTEHMLWLYEHICQYIDDAAPIVDLEYHKFEYKGETLTQLQLLYKLREHIANYINAENEEEDLEKEVQIMKENGDEVFDILKIMYPALWW